MGVKLFFFHLSAAGGKVTTLYLPLILCPKSSILALAHPSMHLITLTATCPSYSLNPSALNPQPAKSNTLEVGVILMFNF